MDEKEWLGAQNQLGLDIWKNKYRYDSEDFEQWVDRVSGHDKEVAQLIKEQKFLFGGRILANRGLEYEGKKITLSNCYVMTPPEDNIESILIELVNWPGHTVMEVVVVLIFPNFLLKVPVSIMRLKKQVVLSLS